MPTLMPSDTAAALGVDAGQCESRSLFMDRFSVPKARDSGNESLRRDWFNELLKKPIVLVQKHGWSRYLGGAFVYAQLQSRLMVNMAGGVMENAGLCLDRFGLPYIPGSAVKGCARRMALAAIHEWCETGSQPEHKPAGSENPCAEACLPFASPADMLAAVARVFGWCEQDWGNEKSDFAWACGGEWKSVRADALMQLGSAPAPGAADGAPAVRSHKGNRPLADAPTDRSGIVPPRRRDFAGSVSFLPAYPVNLPKGTKGLPLEVPEVGKLELDVVTCHHPEYYGGSLLVATDTEDPIPVVFPAIAPGHVFAFALAKLRNCLPDLLRQARSWLVLGLSTFGLGAKTAAGYGWFDASQVVHDSVESTLTARAEQEAAEARQKAENEALARAEQERVARKREHELKKASMSEEERQDYDLDQMDPNHRLQWMQKIDQRSEPEKLAIYRLLRCRSPEMWMDLRHQAEQGKQKEKKRFGPVVQEMFKMAKQRKEKMP